MGNSGGFHQGKPASCNRVALPNPNYNWSSCWVFSCFHNPPNSDMDYRIFNVRTWSFLCVRILYTRGLGTPTASQHNIFDSKKITIVYCASNAGGVRTSGLWIARSRVRRSTNSATPLPRSPQIQFDANNLHHLILSASIAAEVYVGLCSGAVVITDTACTCTVFARDSFAYATRMAHREAILLSIPMCFVSTSVSDDSNSVTRCVFLE